MTLGNKEKSQVDVLSHFVQAFVENMKSSSDQWLTQLYTV